MGAFGWAGFIISHNEVVESRKLIDEANVKLKRASRDLDEMTKVMERAERVVDQLRKER